MNAYANARSLWDAVERRSVAEVQEILAAGNVDVDIESPTLKGQTAFNYAIENSYPEICKLLIHEGKADVNKTDTFGKTPLHTAILLQSQDMCLLLIHEGKADINKEGICGKTPLQLAVAKGSPELCKLLIHECNADVNKAGNYGKTPLQLTVAKGFPELCKLLIHDGNADVNKAGTSGKTPLQLAVTKDSPEFCKLLINEGNADVNKAGNHGKTALHFAVECRLPELCRLLIYEGKADVNKAAYNGETSLHCAVKNSYPDIIRLLILEGKVDVNKADENGKTALHYAIDEGSPEICQLLIYDGKADVNKATTDGQTPLHSAIQKGDHEIWKILINDGQANISNRNFSGKTFLQLAVETGSQELCRFLIYEGNVDVNIADEESQTALHHAVIGGNAEICRLLIIEGKSDVNITDKRGQTALWYAVESESQELCKLLIHEGNADVNIPTKEDETSLLCAVQKMNLEMCRLLIQEGQADVNQTVWFHKSCLHVAVLRGSLSMCRLLILEGNADANKEDQNGQTSLHYSIKSGDPEICKLLIVDGKVDVNKTDINNQTALHHSINQDSLDLCRILIHEGKADVNIATQNDQTALHFAINQESPELCRILIHEGKADVNKATKHCKACLTLAIEKGSLELCKLLLHEGKADVDRPDQEGRTALHHATLKRFPEICTLLIHEGNTDVNKADIDGRTALHHAIQKCFPDICTLLIHEGNADVNKADVVGETALHYAIRLNSSELCKLLIHERKTNVDKATVDGRTSLHYAIEERSLDLCKMLICECHVNVNKTDITGQTALHYAVRQGFLELCNCLITEGKADVNIATKFGLTPLHLAVSTRSSKVCKLIIHEGKANVNKADEKSHTPLHFTAETDDVEICKILLDVDNVDVNPPDTDGLTPLHVAAKHKHTRICQVLLEDGDADVTLRTKNGKTAVDLWPRNGLKYERRILEKAMKETNISTLMKTGHSPIKTIKLFLLGHPHRGKTTLRKTLSRGLFASVLHAVIPGAGRRRLSKPGITIKAENVKGAGHFMIWDTEGDVELQVTQAMLLGTSNGIFIVVYDSCGIEDEQREETRHWLSFIKAGHDPTENRKPIIVLVGTRKDQLGDVERASMISKKNLHYLQDLFGNHLSIHEDSIMVDGRSTRSQETLHLKDTLNKLAEPLREKITPRICDEILKKISSWCKPDLPVLYLTQFLEKVRSDIDKMASEDLLLTALGYLHDMGEVHHAKIKNCDDIIIVNVKWLTSTIFTPVFAPPDMRLDYSGLVEKHEYTIDDFKHHFKINDTDLLVQLLMYFDLVFRNDDGTFIIPVKLPQGTEEITWPVNPASTSSFGLRIECHDQTDIFSVDTFPCLQVSSMNSFRQKHVKPKISLFGLKVFREVEGMLQLTSDKRAIHIAVRVNNANGTEEKGIQQLEEMKCMVFQQISDRSRGVAVNVCFLSPSDLQSTRNLEENVRYYTEEAVAEAERDQKNLVNPETFLQEPVNSVKPTKMSQDNEYESILDYANVNDDLTIPREQLKIITELGSGQFGQVLLAERKTGTVKELVAVKTVKEGAPAVEKDNLLREMKTMKMFSTHPNVVGLIGCCIEKDPYYIIVEHMANGNLKDFLMKSRKAYDYANIRERDVQSSLTPQQLIMFAKQIANGMEFISSYQCIHRDLAARNVLVGKDLSCKVCDFGLSRDIMNTRVYERQSDTPLPLRWMALESLIDDIFTTESDVWSFGILLWEIITLGARPYPGMGFKTVLRELRGGYRMPRPTHCQEDVYNIMLACWKPDPSARPTFLQLGQQLDSVLAIEADYLMLEDIEEDIYDDTAVPEDAEKF